MLSFMTIPCGLQFQIQFDGHVYDAGAASILCAATNNAAVARRGEQVAKTLSDS
jgi:hypothetical protein